MATKRQVESLLKKARKEIKLLQDKQDAVYTNVLSALGQDSYGELSEILFDYMFNDDTLDNVMKNIGPMAQLGARFHGMEKVLGSTPCTSTTLSPLTSKISTFLIAFIFGLLKTFSTVISSARKFSLR